MKIFFNCLVHIDNNIVEDMIFNIKKFVKNMKEIYIIHRVEYNCNIPIREYVENL